MSDAVNVPKDLKLGFVGAGKMAQAVIKGIIMSGLVKTENMTGSAVSDATKNKIKAIGLGVAENEQIASTADVLFIGVKPHMVLDILSGFAFLSSKTLVVSIAAGVTTAAMEKALPAGCRVVRMMPNLPVEVCAGTCALSGGAHATQKDMDLLGALLQPCGYVEYLPEAQMDCCSSVLASIYGAVAIEALADGCVKMGMPRALAIRLSAQTLLGAGKMVLETNKHPGVIKDDVCSPGGTSIAAIHHLEANNFRSALIGAIETQTKRAQYLGKMAAEAAEAAEAAAAANE